MCDCCKPSNCPVAHLGVQAILEGTSAPEGTPIICDVRDVARAHVLASELPLASLQSR